jgi:hypothetical protein
VALLDNYPGVAVSPLPLLSTDCIPVADIRKMWLAGSGKRVKIVEMTDIEAMDRLRKLAERMPTFATSSLKSHVHGVRAAQWVRGRACEKVGWENPGNTVS